MSFRVDPQTGAITMHRGDTGAVLITARRASGVPFGQDDIALWTVRNASGAIVMQNKYALDNESPGNGKVLIQFHNSSTDHMPLGTYYTEMRYIINPYFDGETLQSGDIVRTPENAQSTLTIREVYGEV